MDWLKKLLGDELFESVTAKLGDVKIVRDDGAMIPKSRFDEVIAQRNALQTQIAERDTQLVDLQKSVKDNAELTKQIEQLRDENKQVAQEYDAKLAGQRLDFAVEREIGKADARNVRAVKALLDLANVKLDGDNVTGLTDQLAALKTSDAYLFGPDVHGRSPNPTNEPPPKTDNPWKRETFNLTKQGELLRADPDLAKRYMTQAGVAPIAM